MLKYSVSTGAPSGSMKAAEPTLRRKSKLFVALVVASPLLSMLAGAAFAAHQYGVL